MAKGLDGTEFAALCAKGRALREAAGLCDEVIVPSMTFCATVQAVRAVGAAPAVHRRRPGDVVRHPATRHGRSH
ncbi:DegT/DnrJ/EryC1/StrS family aminotransferase [Streptomyces californicus]|uniref:DegT/DnrJ/EryC1/StrS family aminotransferase n=1 Tax=Streptomyces californicus TaxID=67351 RepID=UPI00383816A2